MSIKVIFNQKECIGSGECQSVSPDFWKVNNNGKAILQGAVLNPATGKYEVTLDDAQEAKQKIAVQRCPVSCISVQKS